MAEEQQQNNDLADLDELALNGSEGGGRRKKKSKILIYMLGGIFVIFVLLFGYFKLRGGDDERAQIDQGTIAERAGNINNSSTKSDSETYREAFKEEDVQRAEERDNQNRSTIPRLMRSKQEPLPPPAPEPAPEPEPEYIPPPEPEPRAVPAPKPEYVPPQGASGSLRQFIGQGEYQPGKVDIDVHAGAKKEKDGEKPNQDAGVNGMSVTPTVSVAPGSLLYAIIDIGANSDNGQTPIIATVASGKYSGARVIGEFSRHDEKLVIKFTRMVVFDKKKENEYTVYGFNGVAIDPQDYTPGVASSVNTHFLERWGGLVASSFLEGFGEAKQRSGSKYVYGNDNNPGQFINDYDVADEAWIAAGKVGEKLSDKFSNNFDRPPTVKVEPGTPIGILAL